MALHRSSLAAGFSLAVLAAASAALADPATPRSFPIADVIAEVKAELQAAQSATGAGIGLSLQKVSLNFALTKTVDANGKVTIGVPVLGGVEVGGSGDHKAEQTSSILIELAPPPGGGAQMSAADVKNLGLTQAIISTREQLLAGMNQPPKLLPEKVVITLKVGVTNSGGPTGQVKFLVFTLGGGLTSSAAETNTIELTFAKAKPL